MSGDHKDPNGNACIDPGTQPNHPRKRIRVDKGDNAYMGNGEFYQYTVATGVNTRTRVAATQAMKGQPTAVASASALVLNGNYNTYKVTGSTAVNTITTDSDYEGREITIVWDLAATFDMNSNTAADTPTLQNGVSITSHIAGSSVTLKRVRINSVNRWIEIGRVDSTPMSETLTSATPAASLYIPVTFLNGSVGNVAATLAAGDRVGMIKYIVCPSANGNTISIGGTFQGGDTSITFGDGESVILMWSGTAWMVVGTSTANTRIPAYA